MTERTPPLRRRNASPERGAPAASRNRHEVMETCLPRTERRRGSMAPAVGFEPTTNGLTVRCATAAPRRNDRSRARRPDPAVSSDRNEAIPPSDAGIQRARPLRKRVGHEKCRRRRFRRVAPCARTLPLLSNPPDPPRRVGRPRGGVVTQRTANPCTPVRFRARPPEFPAQAPLFIRTSTERRRFGASGNRSLERGG